MITAGGRLKDRAHTVTRSGNNKAVYADLMQMPLAGNISRNPHLLRLVEEALVSIQLTELTVQLEHDMKRSVGYCEVIETADTDIIFYACQTKTSGYTRFVKNRHTDTTQYITMNLSRDEEGDYELTDVWIGKAYPALPEDAYASNDSKSFWSGHAVVYNGQTIISSTVTKDCPY